MQTPHDDILMSCERMRCHEFRAAENTRIGLGWAGSGLSVKGSVRAKEGEESHNPDGKVMTSQVKGETRSVYFDPIKGIFPNERGFS